eukprot:jgi/Chlat1/6544/Chrsp45S06010
MVPPPKHPTYDIRKIIQLALEEDAGDIGDVTCQATVPESTRAEAQFLAKADGVLAGVAVADMVFEQVDPSLQTSWMASDGDVIRKGQVIGTVQGPARSILRAERIALNFMQRMSGIATATRAMAEAARPAMLIETRKTAPCLRLIDKWAVLIGGGHNHRMGLFDMVMIKDNHIEAAGGIAAALHRCRAYMTEQNLSIGIEVETRTLNEVQQVLAVMDEAGKGGSGRVTRIMFDNMVVRRPDGSVDTSMLQDAVALVDGRVETEASGNVTMETVGAIGQTGVTYISCGAITHSVMALDISLNIDTQLALEVGKRTHRA